MQNYLETANPFFLKAPPAAWLVELDAYDPNLVIFPSRMEPMFRVTRRAVDGQGIQTVVQRKNNDGTFYAANLDTQTCWEHRLVPVASIHPHVNWSPVVLQDLANRDIKRWGGHAKVSDLIEQQEKDDLAKLDRNEGEDAAVIAGQAYRGWKWTTGQTMDPEARRRSTPATRSGFRRHLETKGRDLISPADERLLVKVPPPVRDRGLVQLTDG